MSATKPYRLLFEDGTVADGFTKAAAARQHLKRAGKAGTVQTFERGYWRDTARQPVVVANDRPKARVMSGRLVRG